MKKKLEIKFLFVNFLTFFRLISASIIALFLYFLSKTNIFYLFYSSFAVFILASISDFFDGFLARKWKIVSEFGQIFDPITDKILTTTTFFFLAYLLLVPWFFVLIFILRDIIVDGLRIFLAKKSVIIAANFWGKLKTVLQIIAISIIFLGYSISVQIYQSYYYLFNLGIIFSAFISLISGFFYIRAIAKLVKGKISN
ncbi:CDP-diacylglycerol--glycerol-3-phosphate 3-phosphatidyltransferase [Mycoplasma flocculare]|uniref:CDP-diacylglycerol--glycerol-3-phosphate 3-phosphatidyltransferase n=1 Tax=Mesomycoplasma flocculare TaxID=2128 RepID=A0AAW9XCB0_MESFC|nr:CDP-diacylglycerol--glycerol-3-phosphate 3-phosphatidyltransferase [Mesomycoplasma flocculare]MXR06006.1 CDP-diacylglycerol--glycerol-3-phosphate 3-phosphatidyltransferase [Mesomycoplasma flocculare]MXR39602.1 CDP-diacylglycerol--glycerol-3-phosphate 3-phosphatidyltransferase [Mycoplasma sp. MF12]MXR56880.1 CDP-diacylglycerol--glycerol-3-phosphate 3-phosphatidyltransferase [Mesomycoplasma flocculare]